MKKRLLLMLVMMFTIGLVFGQESDEKTEKAWKLVQEGVALHDKGQYEEAVKKYDEALKVLPDNPSFVYEKAYSLLALGKRDDAKKVLGKIIKKKSQDKDQGGMSRVYMLQANLLDEDGEQLEALAVYDQALESLPVGDAKLLQLACYNKALTLFNLNEENNAKVEDRVDQIIYYLTASLECNAIHPGTHVLFSGIFSEIGQYYLSIADYAIAALLSGERTSLIEKSLAEWQNKEIDPKSGPLTTLSFNKVRELMKAEPSEYGKLYDVFSTVIPALCRDTLGTPVPLSYASDFVEDGVMPFFTELQRRGLLECYFHEAMKLSKVQYISNANWLVEHKAEEDRLWETINELDVFRKDLYYGYCPDTTVAVTTPEEARKHNVDALAACKFMFTYDSSSKDMPAVMKYILNWSMLSPDVTINIGKLAADWGSTSPNYLVVYMAGCAFAALTSHQKGWNKDVFASGLVKLMQFYEAEKENLGINENLEALLKLNDKESFEKYIEENYDK